MHRLSCFLVAAMIIGFTADLAPAQIGRGRILKKIRDDIFGSPEERAREEAARKAAIQKQKAQAQQKAQLEAQRRAQSGRQPTPINSAPSQNRPSSRNNPLAPPVAPSRNPANRAAPAKKGFGMLLKDADDALVVTRVEANGSAAEAGIRRGDQIVGIGGVKVESKDAFTEIAEILNQGDAIEIAFKRGKKTAEVQINFGSAPESTENEDARLLAPESNRNSNIASSRSGSRINGGSVLDQQSMSQQIDVLNQTVEEQRRVIQQLQNQIRTMQETSAPQGRRNAVPPIRSGNSILQSPRSSSRMNR